VLKELFIVEWYRRGEFVQGQASSPAPGSGSGDSRPRNAHRPVHPPLGLPPEPD
jgi:hypothetical protein